MLSEKRLLEKRCKEYVEAHVGDNAGGLVEMFRKNGVFIPQITKPNCDSFGETADYYIAVACDENTDALIEDRKELGDVEFCESYNLRVEGDEVYEYWIVDSTFHANMRCLGETFSLDSGVIIWCRTTTGVELHHDDCIIENVKRIWGM